MLERYLSIIVSHEEDYITYIETGMYDNNKNFTILKEAVLSLGKKYPSELMIEFNKKYASLEFNKTAAMYHVIGFLDNILKNGVKSKEFFNGMTEKEIYIYATKRILFNKEVLIKCDKLPIIKEFLDDVVNDNIKLDNLNTFFKGLVNV